MTEITESRQVACKRYSELLAQIESVVIPKSSFENVTPFLYYVRVPRESRHPLRGHLKAQGIDTGIHWQPGHRFELLANEKCGDLSITERIADEILSLPLHSKMSLKETEFIAKEIEKFFLSGGGR
jgi:dTDP-4-amino-4,6-dideoxygalactose transaminase